MRKIAKSLIIILLLASAGMGFARFAPGLFASKPCSRPIEFSLGTFDNKFGISQDEFLADVNKAVNIWEQPLGKNLFEYASDGALKVNLVYDYRQEATDKLKSLGFTIDDSKSSYDGLKNKYNSLNAQYKILKQKLDSDTAAYEKQRTAYEQQVAYWNAQGGASASTVAQLNVQRDALNAKADKINTEKDQVNALVDSINALAQILNRLGAALNLNVAQYNTVGQSRGSEFEEGLYTSSSSGRQIDIYEFESQNQLVRVLAHELGHALGLDHIDSDPNAIMYYLNQAKADTATTADIVAVKKLCGLAP